MLVGLVLATSDDLTEPSKYGVPNWVALGASSLLPAALISASVWTIVKHRRQDAVDPTAQARREAAVSASPPDPVAMTMFKVSGLKVLFWLVALVGLGLWMRYGG